MILIIGIPVWFNNTAAYLDLFLIVVVLLETVMSGGEAAGGWRPVLRGIDVKMLGGEAACGL